MDLRESSLRLPFPGGGDGCSFSSTRELPESFVYASRIIGTILEGGKPPLSLLNEQDAWIIAILKKMENAENLHENWEQFVLQPGQNPNGRMAQGVTSISVLCKPLFAAGQFWSQILADDGIRNVKILGAGMAERVARGTFDVHSTAQSFVLPEGDCDSLDQFLSVVLFNVGHPSSARTLVVDNRHGYWDDLKKQASDDFWKSVEVCFAESTEEAIDFIKQHVGEESLATPPIPVEHPFQFHDKNPVLILGTGNAKKIHDARVVLANDAPLLKMYDFINSIGPFVEPEEVSGTCVGNALEKSIAMQNVIYDEAGNMHPHIAEKFGEKFILIANDTGARIRFVDDQGDEVPLDLNLPELEKSRGFIAEGKERWWPGPEIKMVASAEGKSIVFYTQKLPELVSVLSEKVGRQLHIEYVDDSVYLFAVMTPSQKDVHYFATKGVHQDDMISTCDLSVGEADFETFTVPLDDNPERKARADLAEAALLRNSSTANGLRVFLNVMDFPQGLGCSCQFDGVKGNVLKFPRRDALFHVVGTLSAFDPQKNGYGFSDFRKISLGEGFRPFKQKLSFDDLAGFENFLDSVDALLLGGKGDLELSPLMRAALISRIFVAIQVGHPSFAGKPLYFVEDNLDPVCEWFLKTQEFLYNHKLYGRRSQDTFSLAPTLRTALRSSKRDLNSYDRPVHMSIEQGYIDGSDKFDRPTVAILGSASTYDPQHIGIGEQFATGCAVRNLHFRHGGCARGVVGGAADAFAAYRDENGKGRMTGIQCHGLVRLEGINEGNDCVKIHRTIGERKLDIYRSDILCFAAGGWGTYEELFDLLALVESGRVNPDTIIIIDYPFDACKTETTYQPIRQFMDMFMTPEQIQKMNIRFVQTERDALDIVDERLPALRAKFDTPLVRRENLILQIA